MTSAVPSTVMSGANESTRTTLELRSKHVRYWERGNRKDGFLRNARMMMGLKTDLCLRLYIFKLVSVISGESPPY